MGNYQLHHEEKHNEINNINITLLNNKCHNQRTNNKNKSKTKNKNTQEEEKWTIFIYGRKQNLLRRYLRTTECELHSEPVAQLRRY
jgi:hypothetical protein